MTDTSFKYDCSIFHFHLTLSCSSIGSLVVIVGLYILLWGKNKEAQVSESKVNQEIEERKEQEAPQFQVIGITCEPRRV